MARAEPTTTRDPGTARPLTEGVDTAHHRHIRSFVLRQGRMSPAQQRALDTLWSRYGVDYIDQCLQLDTLFGRHAAVVLEIGCGMGETTAAIAKAHPEVDFLGIEVHAPGVGSLLKRTAELDLTNLRVIAHDAVEVIAQMIPAESLAGVHVFFPDPWPKKRHHKRRLLKREFVHEIALRLTSGGVLHVATDWQDYAEEVLQTLSTEPLLVNTAERFAARPPTRPQTKFEARGIALGHGVWDVLFRRR